MTRLDLLRQRSQAFSNSVGYTNVVPSQEVPQAAFEPMSAQPTIERMNRRRELLKEQGDKFGAFAEIKRICKLPIIWPLTEVEEDALNRNLLLAQAYESGFRLFPAQVQAMYEFYIAGGVFGPIGVGWGKTLITLMIANACWQKGFTKMVLFIPPNVRDQLEHDIPWARTKTPITYPIHMLGGRSMKERRSLASSGRKGLYIMPYSLLSTKDSEDNLNDIGAEIILSDEAHRLANLKAARTSRVMHYCTRNQPKWVALSGTITAKGVKDYHHLIRLCLGENNPLPNASTQAEEWGAVINASATESGVYVTDTMAGPLMPLIQWARQHFVGQKFTEDVPGFRLAFQARCRSAPGYVSSGDKDIGTSLIVSNTPVPNHKQQAGWDQLNSLMEKITEHWVTPNGDEIDHAIHQFKWMHELCAGFYNQLTWPEPAEYAYRKGLADDEAFIVLEGAREYHEAGQEYTRALRSWLDSHRIPKCDTPFLVGGEMSRNGPEKVGNELYEVWMAWKEKDFEGRPDRDSSAVRICDYKIRSMLTGVEEWKGEGGLVWVYHKEMGKWAYEYLKATGFNVMHCPAGDQANAAIRDPDNVDKVIVASITSHAEGKNLQHFQNQYVLQWPRQARMAEQMLGRTHRNGQMADELIVRTNATIEFDRMLFSACLNDSLYIHQTTGNRQKMIYCAYDPRPVIFPSHILQARGMQVSILTSAQRSFMEEKFGNTPLDNQQIVT